MPILDHRVHWWRFPIVMFDFETTGVDTATCMPVSVAAVRFEQGEEVEAYYSLLNPGIPIPEGASKIHGITDEQVADAPQLVDAIGEIEVVAADAVPGGYNGETFDKPILHRFAVAQYCPLLDPAQRWIDPLIMIRKIDRFAAGRGRHKLALACARWGVPFAEAEQHNALGDVRALGRLLYRLVDTGKVRPDVTLARLLEYTQQLREEQQREFEAYRARKAAQREFDFNQLPQAPATDADEKG